MTVILEIVQHRCGEEAQLVTPFIPNRKQNVKVVQRDVKFGERCADMTRVRGPAKVGLRRAEQHAPFAWVSWHATVDLDTPLSASGKLAWRSVIALTRDGFTTRSGVHFLESRTHCTAVLLTSSIVGLSLRVQEQQGRSHD